jgi:hypothetical protein
LPSFRPTLRGSHPPPPPPSLSPPPPPPPNHQILYGCTELTPLQHLSISPLFCWHSSLPLVRAELAVLRPS